MSIHYSNMIIFLTLLIFTECIRSLKLLELHVPGHVLSGARAQLSCRWALGSSEQLYSVKWYKDGREFFRHVPRNQEPCTKFKLPGVEVEYSDSSGSNLTLSAVSLETSGRYRCEVSGEKPLFPTVSDHADLEVIVLPDYGPIISGLHPRYKIGDKLEVKCTSGKSHPETKLGWYINGEPAPAIAVLAPTHQNDSRGHKITSLMLHFIISEKDFIDSRLKIKCLATLFPFYWRSNEKSAIKQRNLIYGDLEVKSTQAKSIEEPIVVHRMRTTTNTGHKMIAMSIFMITYGVILCLAPNKFIQCLLH